MPNNNHIRALRGWPRVEHSVADEKRKTAVKEASGRWGEGSGRLATEEVTRGKKTVTTSAGRTRTGGDGRGVGPGGGGVSRREKEIRAKAEDQMEKVKAMKEKRQKLVGEEMLLQ